MNSERVKKQCQSCKKDFTIEPEDFDFYEKMEVPAPTWCPDCRRRRRLAWFNLTNLYHRDCDLCKKRSLSMYPADAPYTVYCPECFWSDKWDWRTYAQEYDFSRPFFQQFDELLHKTPLLGLSNSVPTMVNSPYNNGAGHVKNCYLTFDSSFVEDSAFGLMMVRDTSVFDCSMVMDCESCYDCMNLFKSSHCIGTRGNIRFCLDSAFLRDCDNCTNCFMCANLKNQKFCFKNQQYTKEEYFKKRNEYNLASYAGYMKAKKDAEEFWQESSLRPAYEVMSVNVTGSYIFNSKNCKECYDITDAEDCAYCMALYGGAQKNCYDISRFGDKLENAYECNVVGELSSQLLFCDEGGIGLQNAEYTKLSVGGLNNFGCVSVRKGNYVILNKEYSKEEYKILREKIVKHMNEMPYTDKKGRIYSYGEFFPLELSPLPYNVTFADLFYPKTDEELQEEGLWFFSGEKQPHVPTKKAEDIPDAIENVPDTICKEVIECSRCKRGYKIIEMELAFLRKEKIALPHVCPFCRIREKMLLWVDNMTLKDRVCGKCGISFRTHYSETRAPHILCKTCYNKEYL